MISMIMKTIFIPLSLSFERISSLLTLAWQNIDGDCETLESSKTVKGDGILQIFVATSLNQIICKETASLANIAEKDIQYQLALGQFDAIETGFLYVYVFLSSLYDGQTCKGSFKFKVFAE